ncbi:hypothetical protein [Dictyobacter kobayashii]|uniref:DinB-like domain-containing protein n=1 Tax=Dictyobacter kobayashii TaxID=2014872 RepID=A0A402AQS3_9CHLR|nr:hypothetical protein [Dictyobacter kobayashii]GCE21443.1 hypothetical protein KDK_52430 [Dictyobacter kobayashii]
MSTTLSKEQLIQEFAAANERTIEIATEAAQRGITSKQSAWGPREVIAHMAGWEVMATVRIPRIVAGMAPLEEPDEERRAVMNDAINTMIVTMIGDQSLATICGILARRTAQRRTAQDPRRQVLPTRRIHLRTNRRRH